MYVYIAIWMAGFLLYVIMSVRNYKEEVRNYLPKVLPENRKEAKKYMLIESLLFVLSPEIAMIGMAIMPFSGIDITDPWILFEVVASFAVIAFLSIGFSGIYGEKVQNLISKKSQEIGAA
ncbi:MAG: hypothetical protein WC788_01420 [Candidatus Paceibacterota bacterium]|jgi:hypothetical protein